ncbi:MAG: hypothetical protein ACJ8J0_14250 [Longimicrobiaceae bacterium]
MRSFRYAIALALTFAGAARAQSPSPDSLVVPAAFPGGAVPSTSHRNVRTLAAGDSVRIVAAAGRYSGTILRVTPDTVVVRAPGRLDAIPRGEVTSLERFTGKSSRGRAILTGGGAGLAGGALLGGIAGRLMGRIHCKPADEPCTPGGHDATIQGAMLAEGALLGALVGAMFGPTFRREHWERAEGSFPLQAAPAPAGGVAAGVTLRF